MIGKIRFRQTRKNKKPCDKMNDAILKRREGKDEKIFCISDGDDLMKRNINGTASWQKYQRGSEPVSMLDFSDYSGFIKDFETN